MSSSDIAIQLAAALGEYSNFQSVQVAGYNPAVGAAYEDVWAPGGNYPFPTLLATNGLEAVSTDAADDAAGTGARTIRVTGLSGQGGLLTESVTLDGVTPVPLTQAFSRIIDVVVTAAGSGQTNAGDISLVELTSGDVMSFMPAGYGRQQQVIVSLNDPALVTLNLSVGDAAGAVAAGNVVQFRIESRTFLPAQPNNPCWIVRDEFQVTDSAGQVQRVYNPLKVWGAEISTNRSFTDFRLRARCATSSMLVQAVAGFWVAAPDTPNGFRSYPFP